MKNLIMIMSAVVMLAAPGGATEGKKVRVLILSGANNHKWKQTTPALKAIYEESGRFTVDVTENVPNLTGKDFAKYDVIVSNYTTYPKVKGKRWPAETEKAFLDYIASGHGFVLFHAASTAWMDWPEFRKLIGLAWQKDAEGKNISGHGRQHAFTMKITAPDHPVTKGMSNHKNAVDELYHRQLLDPGAKVLATAFSDKKMRGSGKDEPMVVAVQYGKGRVINCAMGHSTRSMKGAGFKAFMLRGAEWAATGKVTIPVPKDLPPADK